MADLQKLMRLRAVAYPSERSDNRFHWYSSHSGSFCSIPVPSVPVSFDIRLCIEGVSKPAFAQAILDWHRNDDKRGVQVGVGGGCY